MKFILLPVITFALMGCAGSSRTYTSDGRTGHSLNCSGTARNWGMCEQKAGEICGSQGYEVLSTTGDTGAVLTASRGGVYASTTRTRTMLIACR